jgi:hypothetical protein
MPAPSPPAPPPTASPLGARPSAACPERASRGWRGLRAATRVVFALALTSACEATSGQPEVACEAPAFVVVHSDYRSTAVSLVAADGTRCAPDLLTSGMAAPGLLNALSGDVVTTRGPRPDGLVGVLDRYPAGVLTLLDPGTGRVTHQTPLSPGFAGNPQDLLPLAPGLDLVTRLQRAPGAVDAGSDLVLVTHPPAEASGVLSGAVLARRDLSDLALPGFGAMPTRLARVGDVLFVGLAHLAPDFASAGEGRVALAQLAPAPEALSEAEAAAWLAGLSLTAVSLPGRENCASVEASPDGLGAWVVCTGGFRGAAAISAGQAERSGLAFISASGEVAFSVSAASLTAPLGATAPLGFTLAALDASRAVVVALGDFATGRPDRALRVTRVADGVAEATVVAETEPFAFGGALADADRGVALLADGDPRRPRLLRLDVLNGSSGAPPVALTGTSDTGLPPRHVSPR